MKTGHEKIARENEKFQMDVSKWRDFQRQLLLQTECLCCSAPLLPPIHMLGPDPQCVGVWR